MKILINESKNPYFNLSMEEYILKNKEDDFFILWQNDKSIIIGKNQNTYAEINNTYVTENNINVVRRITGGGAVFHDLGNVNYTYIKRNSRESFNNYKEFCGLIINYLRTLGINAELSGRNDMLIEGYKFSGNAQCAFGNSVMHHGTLLFSSSMNDLSKALNVNPLKIESKGIKSIRSRVTNISKHLKNDINVNEFIYGLKQFAENEFDSAKVYNLSENDIQDIDELMNKKYLTFDWNYGFKQEYSIKNEKKYDFGLIQLYLNVVDNRINLVKLYGDFFGEKDISELENSFVGVLYNKDSISDVLNSIDIDKYIKGIKQEYLIELFF